MGQFTITEENQAAVLEHAKANREAEKEQHVETVRTEVHRGALVTDGTGPPRRLGVVSTVTDDLPAGQVRVGALTTSVETAQKAGLIDASGDLTDKGKAAAASASGETGPSPSDLADRRNAAVQAEIERAWAAARERKQSKAQERLNTAPDERHVRAEEPWRPSLEPAPATSTATMRAAVEAAFQAGDLDGVVDAAESAHAELGASPEFAEVAADYVLNGGGEVGEEALDRIASAIGVDTGRARALVDTVVDGYRAEAATAVKGILAPELAASFAAYVEATPDVFRRGAAQHRHGSLDGWQREAEKFAEAVRGVNPADHVGAIHGGQVFEDGGRYWVSDGERVVEFYAALASGFMADDRRKGNSR